MGQLANLDNFIGNTKINKIHALFPCSYAENYISLESRRYIGNKAKLSNWIMSKLTQNAPDAKSFFDVFAGTASVTKAALSNYSQVYINDFLFSNNIIYKGFFSDSPWHKSKIIKLIDYYNNIQAESLGDNYFSEWYGDKFFDNDNAKIIGFIRDDIEQRKSDLTQKEFALLLTSLIYAIDKIANTVGHFDAYIKKEIRKQQFFLKLPEQINSSKVSIFREDANLLAPNIIADIAYLDPPYNSRQYSRFYHIYENLVKWDKPMLYGVALKPKVDNMSAYCTVKAVDAFESLVSSLNVKYIAVSYNNTYDSKSNSSKNKISLDQLKRILESRGETKIFESSHKFFNTGKTEFKDHKELLFFTKVTNDSTRQLFPFSDVLRRGQI